MLTRNKSSAIGKLPDSGKIIQRKKPQNSKLMQKKVLLGIEGILNNNAKTEIYSFANTSTMKCFIPLKKLKIDFAKEINKKINLSKYEEDESKNTKRNETDKQNSLKRKSNINLRQNSKLKKKNEEVAVVHKNEFTRETRSRLRNKKNETQTLLINLITEECTSDDDIYKFNSPSSPPNDNTDDLNIIKKLQKNGKIKIVKPKIMKEKKQKQFNSTIWNKMGTLTNVLQSDSKLPKAGIKRGIPEAKQITQPIMTETTIKDSKKPQQTDQNLIKSKLKAVNKESHISDIENVSNENIHTIWNKMGTLTNVLQSDSKLPKAGIKRGIPEAKQITQPIMTETTIKDSKKPQQTDQNLIKSKLKAVNKESHISDIENVSNENIPINISPAKSMNNSSVLRESISYSKSLNKSSTPKKIISPNKSLSPNTNTPRLPMSPLNVSNIENVDPIKNNMKTPVNTQNKNPQRSPLKSLINNQQQHIIPFSLRNTVLSNNANKANAKQINLDFISAFNENELGNDKLTEELHKNIDYNLENYFGFDDFDYVDEIENDGLNKKNNNSLKIELNKLKEIPMPVKKIINKPKFSPIKSFDICEAMCSTMIDPITVSSNIKINRKRTRTDLKMENKKQINKKKENKIMKENELQTTKLFDEPDMENVDIILKMPDDEIFKPIIPRKQYKRKPVVDKELESFAMEFNSMCEEVDSYELIIE